MRRLRTQLCWLSLLLYLSITCSAQFRPLPTPIQGAHPHFVSTQDFWFIDSKGYSWKAPVGTKTDGASIPQIAWSIIGQPLDYRWRGAALVHDAYCGEDNKAGSAYGTAKCLAIHHMFYEACLAGGTPLITAKLMYAAVWMFGPDDAELRTKRIIRKANKVLNKPIKEHGHGLMPTLAQSRQLMEKAKARETLEQNAFFLDLKQIPDTVKQAQFVEVRDFISTANPSVDSLELVLRQAKFSLYQRQIIALPDSSH
jgi:hypothetical protein